MKRSDVQVSPDQIIEALMAQIGQLSAELAMARAENTALWAAMSDAEVTPVPEPEPVPAEVAPDPELPLEVEEPAEAEDDLVDESA